MPQQRVSCHTIVHVKPCQIGTKVLGAMWNWGANVPGTNVELVSKGAFGVIAGRPGLHGLQFEAWSQISDMPSNSGNMGGTYFQEFGPNLYGRNIFWGFGPILWVKNSFGDLVPFLWMKNSFRSLVPRFYG